MNQVQTTPSPSQSESVRVSPSQYEFRSLAHFTYHTMTSVYTDKQMCLAALERLHDAKELHVWVDNDQLTSTPVYCVLGGAKVQLFKLPATLEGMDVESDTGCNLYFDHNCYSVVLDTRRPFVPEWGIIPVGGMEASARFNKEVMGDEAYFTRLVVYIIMWVVNPEQALEIFLSDEVATLPQPIAPKPAIPEIVWGNLESSTTPLPVPPALMPSVPEYPPGYFNPEEAEEAESAPPNYSGPTVAKADKSSECCLQ